MPLSRRIIIEETNNYVRNAQLNPSWLGKELVRQDWPVYLQNYIERLNKSDGLKPIPGMPYIGLEKDCNSSVPASQIL